VAVRKEGKWLPQSAGAGAGAGAGASVTVGRGSWVVGATVVWRDEGVEACKVFFWGR
jgi:hypothetical protein